MKPTNEDLEWTNTIESIDVDAYIEEPSRRDYDQYYDEFKSAGLTRDLFDRMYPLLYQSVWSTFALFKLAKSVKRSGIIAEIGSAKGGSLITMFLANPTCVYYCIDPFEPYNAISLDSIQENRVFSNFLAASYETFLKNIEPFSVNKIIVKLKSDEAITQLQNIKFDMIFIDGCHEYEYVKRDIQNYKLLLNDNGILCGHDFHPRFNGVIKAVKECIDGYFVIQRSSIWVTLY